MLFLQKSKIFKDVIHDSIEVTLLANSIIDTKIFQRLRNLHQLGVCYFVFSNANNNRFEHSIGTYYLAGKLINSLITNSLPFEVNKALFEIKFIKKYLLKNNDLEDNIENINYLIKSKNILLDDYLMELIKIAGLIHDLGHGPFSHLFDEWLHNLPDLDHNNLLIEHENRSIILFNEIINKTKINISNEYYKMNEIIDNDAFEFISELVNPMEDTPDNFIFQIISNSLNGLDVDKLDYLCRDSFYFGAGQPFDLTRIISHAQVIDLNICFPEKISYDIYKVYRSRYDLHKQYYNHKTVVIIEYMIRFILEKLDNILQISDSIKNNKLDKFIDLLDSTILNTTSIIKLCDEEKYRKHKENIDEIENMLNRIYNRKLYKCLYSKSFCVSEIIDVDLKIKELLLDDKELLNKKLNKDIMQVNNILPVKLKIGLLGGNKSHPFDNLYFYDKNNKSDILSKDKVSHLMSSFFQEIILYILYLD